MRAEGSKVHWAWAACLSDVRVRFLGRKLAPVRLRACESAACGLASMLVCLAGAEATAQTRGTLQPSVSRPEGGGWSGDIKRAPAAPMRARAVAIKVGVAEGRTRVRISVTQPIVANMFLLDAPYRLVVDVPELEFRIPATSGNTSTGLVKSYVYGQFDAGRSRIVISLTGPVKVENAQFSPPSGKEAGTLSFDLVQASAADFASMLGDAPSASAAAQPAAMPRMPGIGKAGGATPPGTGPAMTGAAGTELARAAAGQPPTERALPGKRNRPVIVVDPGHGGIDPGTVASATAMEKVVTLAVATQVRNLLMQARKYDVHMTRQSDVFVSLDQRVKLSRSLDADLFVSIHADSLAEKEFAQAIKGATIYTLSERASDERASRMAEKENAADVLAGLAAVPASAEEQVRSILQDLVQRETANYSVSFRNLLLGQMKGRVPLAKDPQRSAAFKVLRQAETPAVLIELGYMSNASDLERLTKPEGQKVLAQAIAVSIDAFFAQKSGGGAKSGTAQKAITAVKPAEGK